MYNPNSIYVLHKQINCKGWRKFRWPFAWFIQWAALASGHPKDLPNPNHTAGLYFYKSKMYVFESLGNGVINRSYLSFLESTKKEGATVWLEEAFETNKVQLDILVKEINRLVENKAKYDVKKAIKTAIYHPYSTPLSRLLKSLIKLFLGKTKDSNIDFFCTEVFQFLTKLTYPCPKNLKKADISIVCDYPKPETAQPHRLLGFFCRDEHNNIDVRKGLKKREIIKLNLDKAIRCVIKK